MCCRVRCIACPTAYFASNLYRRFFKYTNECSDFQTALDKKIKLAAPENKGVSTAKIAYTAMFVAINVVVGAFSPRIGSLKVTLTYTLCFLCGYFFGGTAGALAGGLGDLLGSLIGGYAPNPLILLCSCLLGLIPALVGRIPIKPRKVAPYIHIAVSFIICFVVCTLFLNTYALYVLGLAKGASFWMYMAIRAGTQAPVAAVNFALCVVFYPLFKKLLYNLNLVFAK